MGLKMPQIIGVTIGAVATGFRTKGDCDKFGQTTSTITALRLQQVLEPKGIATTEWGPREPMGLVVATGFRTKGDCDD